VQISFLLSLNLQFLANSCEAFQFYSDQERKIRCFYFFRESSEGILVKTRTLPVPRNAMGKVNKKELLKTAFPQQ
jgi:hypothetical protein